MIKTADTQKPFELLFRQDSERISVSFEQSFSVGKICPSVLPLKKAVLTSAGHQIGKEGGSCEDAFFVSERGFGVADGVGGWSDYGLSSAEFSH